jgi:tellurite resistance protein TerC
MVGPANIIKAARKIIVLVIGGTILLIGVIMLVTPGPAIVVIPVGLAVLATEFVWAKRLLTKVREEGTKIGTVILEAIPVFGRKFGRKGQRK